MEDSTIIILVGSILFLIIIVGIIILVIITYGNSRRGIGQPCGNQGECKNGLVCSNDGFCKTGKGEKCIVDSDCSSGLSCQSGICLPSSDDSAKGRTIIVKPNPVERASPVVGYQYKKEYIAVSSEPNTDANGHKPHKNTIKISQKPKKKKEPNKQFDPQIGKIIDACTYSCYNLYLNGNSLISCQTVGEEDVTLINSNTRIVKITTFNNILYSLSNNSLYQLDNNTINGELWSWIQVPWAPKHIVNITSTISGSHLWIQTNDRGYLYNSQHGQVVNIKYPMSRYRVYGRNEKIWMDIDREAHVGIEGRLGNHINDIWSGIYLNNDDFVAVDSMSGIADVRLVNWEPYYLYK